jgi:hypothetical protein
MGLGSHLIGDLEQLLAARTIGARALFRMTGVRSQAWRAEQEIRAMYHDTPALLLPSASIGTSLVIEALALEPGQEVLIAPFGWLSNWSCIRRAGLVPRFCPLGADLQLRVEDVERRIGKQTAAVVVTHVMGRGQQQVDEIARLCERRGVVLLEDIAQSFGITIGGRRAGTFGSAAWCSLNHHKVISTGDGGFVVARDPAVFARITALHDQGCTMREGKRIVGTTAEPGLSLRVSELTAAILRAQLARFHLLRARILKLHAAVSGAVNERLGLSTIPPHAGDLPFTVLVQRPPGMDYPSLADSGWHLAGNVPWLSEAFSQGCAVDDELAGTTRAMERLAAVGAGFIDPYYAIPAGVAVNDPASAVPALIESLAALIPAHASWRPPHAPPENAGGIS